MKKTKQAITLMLSLIMAFQLMGFNQTVIYANSSLIDEYINTKNKPMIF